MIANPQPLMAATHEEIQALQDARRSELAFLYSTPAYRRQLERIGVADLGALEQLVPHGTYDEIPELLGQWYAGLCDGLTIAVPAGDDDALTELVRKCRMIPTLSGRREPRHA